MKVNFFYHAYPVNTSFSSREDIYRKAEHFADEIIQQASSDKFELADTQKIASKYVKGIKVKKLKKSTVGYNNIGGVYRSKFVYLYNPNRVETKGRKLEIRTDISTKQSSKEKLLTILHEMVHALQSVDPDMCEDKLINESLKNLPLEQWPKQINTACRTFEKLEREILEPIIFAHQDLCTMNDGINPYDISVNREKIKKLINQKLDKIKLENPNINMDFLRKYLYLH